MPRQSRLLGSRNLQQISPAATEIDLMRSLKGGSGVHVALLLSLMLGGCSRIGAPSFVLFGAFFPDWMFCALIGILVAVVARIAFVSTGLANVLPYQLFVCLSVGLIVASLAWLFWFG
jgi:YtcA family